MKKTTLTILLLFFIAFSFGQTVIYQEDFTGQDGKGAIGPTPTIDTTGVTWTVDVSAASLTTSTDWFMVNNEMMEGKNVNGKAVWISPNIDISNFSNVKFSLNVTEGGGLESDDVITTEYTLDGGTTWVIAGTQGVLSGTFTSGTPSQLGLNGSNLQIRTIIENNEAPEYIRFDDVTVEGTFSHNSNSNVTGNSQPPNGVISSLETTPVDAVFSFSIKVSDAGGDGLPTKLIKARIIPASSNSANWATTIQGVVIKDGNNNTVVTASYDVTNSYIDIYFNSGDFDVPEGGNRDLNLNIFLTSNVSEGDIISFKVPASNHGFIADFSGSIFSDTFSEGDIISNEFKVGVVATELQFIQQPIDVLVNTVMAPAVIVAYTDVYGNVDVNVNGNNTNLTSNGANLATSTTTNVTSVDGILSFSDIEFDTIGSGVILTITDNSMALSVNSNPFDVTSYPKCNITLGKIIGQQDFEDTPATPALLTDIGADIFPSTGNGLFPNDPMYVSGSKGVKVNNSGTNKSIVFGPIDTSKYENVTFSIRLASFASAAGAGADAGDFVRIKIKNGSAAYSNEIEIKGKNSGNNRWSFLSGTGVAEIVYDGDNLPNLFQPTVDGDVTTEGYSTIRITNLPITKNLRIKVVIKNNQQDEIWVLDDAILKGDQKDYTVWKNSTTTWSNGVPNATTKAFFDTSYNMNNKPSVTACECEVKSNKKVTVTSGKFLQIGNDIVNNGTIYVKNKGSLIQLNKNVTITGTDFQIEKITTPYRMYDYTYWSSPIENADIATVFAANPLSYIYDFNTANFSDTDNDSFDDNGDDWQHASGTMTVGKGYIAMGEGAQFPVPNPIPTTTQQQTVLFTGKINNGDIFVPVSLDANSSDSYINQNLIGNPYPSAISAPAFLTKNSNLAGTLYFWTHNDQISSVNSGPDTYNFTNDSYVTYVAGSGGALGNCGGCAVPTDYIASGQGFFADLSQSAGNGTVVFTNAMRSDQNNNFYRTPQNEKNRIWFNMTTDTNDFRQILIGFFDEATNDDDRDYDGKRLINGNNFDFYSLIDNQKYAVQGVPTLIDTRTIPVGVEIITDCQVTFSIDRFEGDLDQVNVYLHDMNLGIYHDLKQANYVIDMLQGEYANRFEMVFSRNALNLNNQVLTDENKLIVANHNDQVLVKVLGNHIMKQIDVYDVIGKLITSVSVDTNEINLNDNYKSGAVYFVKVRLNNGQKISKKFLKL